MELTIEQALKQGMTAHNSGNFQEAVDVYQAILQSEPKHSDANHQLGLIAISVNQIEAAVLLFKTALEVSPNIEQFWISYIDALVKTKRLKDAKQAIREATKKGFNTKKLATLLSQSKDVIDTKAPPQERLLTLLECYQNGQFSDAENLAIAISQEFPSDNFSWKILAAVFKSTGRNSEAVNANQIAVDLCPQDAQAHYNFGNILEQLGRLEEAGARYAQAIALQPHLADAHSNLGVTLQALGRFDEAEASYRKAIALNQDLPSAHSNLGGILRERGLQKESLDCHLKAMSLNPNSVSFRWEFALGQLAKVYLTHKDMEESLHGLEEELTKLQEFITAERLQETATFTRVGSSYPYHLAYIEKDNKYLLRKHGELCCRIMKNWQEKNLISPVNSIRKRYASGKIKIGIVSAHIRYHSVWNAFLKGVIKNLDSEKFEIHIFSLSNICDGETDLAKTIVEYFNEEERGLIQWANKIRNSEIDIAFYPEIGMDKQTIQLASMRLAPIQVCSYGHPETSGLPTIDYYISSELLETSNSDSFYTEKLFKLPGLGYYFEPPTLESSDADLIQMGINQNLPKLLCLGNPSKFSPLYDWVLIAIIRRLGNCQLIFMHDVTGASEILQKRLKDRIEDAGFIFKKHVVFVSLQSREGFSALMKSADLLMDTLGFSGLNTTMQAIGCGLPVITLEGEYQRSRHAGAILRTLGVEELITKTETEYIDLVERFILDREFRLKIRRKIKDNENCVYRNEAPIRVLEIFFEDVISGSLKGEAIN